MKRTDLAIVCEPGRRVLSVLCRRIPRGRTRSQRALAAVWTGRA